MCAEVLATAGLAVTVYEHMPSVGRKFLLAGRSGLNITHSEPIERLISRYGTAPQTAWTRRSEPSARGAAIVVRVAGRDDLRRVDGPGVSRVIARHSAASCLVGPPGATGRDDRSPPSMARMGGEPDGPIDARRSLFSSPDAGIIEVASDITVLALGGASWPRVGSDGGWVDVLRETRRRRSTTFDPPTAACVSTGPRTSPIDSRGTAEERRRIDVGGVRVAATR